MCIRYQECTFYFINHRYFIVYTKWILKTVHY